MKILIFIIISLISVCVYGQDALDETKIKKLGVELKWTGKVQGVGFRAYVKNNATDKNKVVGWIANQSDGSVMAYAEADEKDIKAFVKVIMYGPRSGNAENIEIKFIKAKGGFNSFKVDD